MKHPQDISLSVQLAFTLGRESHRFFKSIKEALFANLYPIQKTAIR